jgi:tripartite-type tricarboxylate transporter receptor subunit TctC
MGNVQTHVLNGAAMKLDYDVVNDFVPISLIADTPIWIIARKSLPAGDLNELIAWLKARDGKATAGTVGVGVRIPAGDLRRNPVRLAACV